MGDDDFVRSLLAAKKSDRRSGRSAGAGEDGGAPSTRAEQEANEFMSGLFKKREHKPRGAEEGADSSPRMKDRASAGSHGSDLKAMRERMDAEREQRPTFTSKFANRKSRSDAQGASPEPAARESRFAKSRPSKEEPPAEDLSSSLANKGSPAEGSASPQPAARVSRFARRASPTEDADSPEPSPRVSRFRKSVLDDDGDSPEPSPRVSRFARKSVLDDDAGSPEPTARVSRFARKEETDSPEPSPRVSRFARKSVLDDETATPERPARSSSTARTLSKEQEPEQERIEEDGPRRARAKRLAAEQQRAKRKQEMAQQAADLEREEKRREGQREEQQETDASEAAVRIQALQRGKMSRNGENVGFGRQQRLTHMKGSRLGRADMKRLFEAVDDDGSGKLEETEGKRFLATVGVDSKEERDFYWEDLLKDADQNADERVSRAEFLDYMCNLDRGKAQRELRKKETSAKLLEAVKEREATAAQRKRQLLGQDMSPSPRSKSAWPSEARPARKAVIGSVSKKQQEKYEDTICPSRDFATRAKEEQDRQTVQNVLAEEKEKAKQYTAVEKALRNEEEVHATEAEENEKAQQKAAEEVSAAREKREAERKVDQERIKRERDEHEKSQQEDRAQLEKKRQQKLQAGEAKLKVTNVYIEALGRAPDEAELDSYVMRIARYGDTPEQVEDACKKALREYLRAAKRRKEHEEREKLQKAAEDARLAHEARKKQRDDTSDRPELHQATEMPDTIDHKILTIFFKEKAPRKLKTVHDLIERNKAQYSHAFGGAWRDQMYETLCNRHGQDPRSLYEHHMLHADNDEADANTAATSGLYVRSDPARTQYQLDMFKSQHRSQSLHEEIQANQQHIDAAKRSWVSHTPRLARDNFGSVRRTGSSNSSRMARMERKAVQLTVAAKSAEEREFRSHFTRSKASDFSHSKPSVSLLRANRKPYKSVFAPSALL